MWKNKKIIAAVLLVIVIVAGSTTAVAFAQANNGASTQAQARYDALLDRVSAIYQEKTGVSIDSVQLKAAITQAQTEAQSTALDTFLKNMVDSGKMTQEQADQYKQWMQARPDTPLTGPMMGPGFKGGMMGGRGGMRGFGGGCGGPGWQGINPGPEVQSN